MTTLVQIGNRQVGAEQPCFIIGEIGINHNGDINIAKKLIQSCVEAGCDIVKFQKRTIEVVYSASELAMPRPSVFGDTNGDLKRGLEFGEEEYAEINTYCRELGIPWFASCWDEASVDFIEKFAPPAYKIASASLTDHDLLRHHRSKGRPIILSTGMSTIEQIDAAIDVLGTDNLIILHSTSTYPCPIDQLNLKTIKTLAERYGIPVGYSGHEVGLSPSLAAVTLGACILERHVTLDRSSWGSDQAASVEPHGMKRLIANIRTVERALGDGTKKIYDSELPIIEKLRRVDAT
jgi:N-acetylneuraminate synthase